MRPLTITGGVDADGRPISITITNGTIGGRGDEGPTLDATGFTVVPGFIDIQINGAFSHDFTADPTSIWTVGERLPETGVTAFCPTIITAPEGAIRAAQDAKRARPNDYVGAEPLGLHLEGPHLAPKRRGTHPASDLRLPSEATFILDDVALVTLAPELPGALPLIRSLVERGVIVSIGHSDASAEEARAALDAGASLGTHLFNTMPPISAREPGIAGVLLADPRCRFSVIVDGHHHDRDVIRLAWNAARDRFVIITDAIAAAAMPDGEYRIGSVDVTVEAGAARNAEGMLAGATATMETALGNLIEITGSTLASALRSVTSTPAAVLGRHDIGGLEHGMRGDVTLLARGSVVATIVGGAVAHLRDPARLTPS
jgi:N-acetylglucosamine-6-phosphate deacetylase